MIDAFGPGIFIMQAMPYLLFGILVFGVISLFSSSSGANILVRILWFTFVGWWLGLFWFGLSVLLMASIIFLPVGAWAATKTWKVMTLAGSESPSDAVSDVSVEIENKVRQQTNAEALSDSEESEDSDETGFESKLQKLKDLKEDGIITEEEFEQKKEDIMDGI